MRQKSVFKIVAPVVIGPAIALGLVGYLVWDATASGHERDKHNAAITEQVEAFDSELVHARTTEKQNFEDEDSRVAFPIFWTDDQDNAGEIAVAATEYGLDYVGVIVAPETQRLGPNTRAEECWIFEADALVDAQPENALPRGTLVLPEEGGYWRSDNWCQEHGFWEKKS